MRNWRTRGLVLAAPVVALTVGMTMSGAEGGDAVTATLRSVDGVESGTVKVATSENSARVTAYLRLPAAAAGFHGFHIHAKGVCDPSSVDPATGSVVPFFSAGGHLGGAGGQTHAGHDGDMPSLLVTSKGTAQLRFKTDRLDLAEILDADGSAVIVHAGPDNFANVPIRYSPTGPDATTLNTGDSGGRAYCGVIR